MLKYNAVFVAPGWEQMQMDFYFSLHLDVTNAPLANVKCNQTIFFEDTVQYHVSQDI